MIRYAKKEELDQVNAIRKQVFELHAKGREDLCRREPCEEFESLIYKLWEEEGSDVIVAIKEGQIIAFASVEYIDRPMSLYMEARRYYHVIEFGVHQNYRRQKVATELFVFIKEESISHGFDRMELDVFTFNEGAVKFYQAMGFMPYRIYMEQTI